ncbi:hypothetical protein CYL16_12220 [Mycobacterium sp. EPG1]|nr:hypothetical protein CYL16_12220 [Mycobacterium sp. EPG1]
MHASFGPPAPTDSAAITLVVAASAPTTDSAAVSPSTKSSADVSAPSPRAEFRTYAIAACDGETTATPDIPACVSASRSSAACPSSDQLIRVPARRWPPALRLAPVPTIVDRSVSGAAVARSMANSSSTPSGVDTSTNASRAVDSATDTPSTNCIGPPLAPTTCELHITDR